MSANSRTVGIMSRDPSYRAALSANLRAGMSINQAVAKAKAPAAAKSSDEDKVAELVRLVNAAQGRNAVERMNAVMLEKIASHGGLPLDQQVKAAGDALASLQAGKYPAGFPVVTPEAAPTVQSLVAAYNASPGRNPVEKANALLCSRSPSHQALDYAEQCRRAGEFVRDLMGGNLPSGVR